MILEHSMWSQLNKLGELNLMTKVENLYCSLILIPKIGETHWSLAQALFEIPILASSYLAGLTMGVTSLARVRIERINIERRNNKKSKHYIHNSTLQPQLGITA